MEDLTPLSASATPGGTIVVIDINDVDEVTAAMVPGNGLVGPSIGDGVLVEATIVLFDNTTAALLSGDGLPTAIELDSFTAGSWNLRFDTGGFVAGQSGGLLTSISGVPLPGAVWLFGAAIAFLFRIRAKSRPRPWISPRSPTPPLTVR